MIFAKPNGEFIEIRFRTSLDIEVFRDYVDRIKRINGRRYVPKKGDNHWVIPISQQGYLKSLFDRKEIEWEIEEAEPDLEEKNISDDFEYLDELALPPYPFQVLGINFLCEVERGIMADEMGLGKSVQMIGAAYKLHRRDGIKDVLIICPSSLKFQWDNEIRKFLDVEERDVDIFVIDGTPKQRVDMYDDIHESDKFKYVIINYELILRDVDYLLEFDWDVIGVDEAHRIKNWKSKTSKNIKKLDAPYKWCATGTPIQNKPDEIFNIFSFVDASVLGKWYKFRNDHIIIGRKFKQNNMILGYKNLGLLHKKINPYMLRRLKKEVAPELPDMIISNYYIEMYREQFSLHEKIREELYDLIKEISQYTERDENGNIIKQHPRANSLLGMFTMLQEVCDTPELLQISDSNMASKYAIETNKCPKLDELEKILGDFLDSYSDSSSSTNRVITSENGEEVILNGDKAVIFTQFSRMQALIVERISKLGKCEIINGSMSSIEKQERMNNFRMDPDIKFICCTDAANYGVNLQQANLLVNFEVPWNPAVWQQRNARIHRINSDHDNINIINLIAKDGLDEKILDVLYDKQNIASSVIEKRDNEKRYLNKLTNSVMTKVLK